MKITKKSRLTIILFIMPALIVYLMWVIYPIISAIWMRDRYNTVFGQRDNYLKKDICRRTSIITVSIFYRRDDDPDSFHRDSNLYHGGKYEDE